MAGLHTTSCAGSTCPRVVVAVVVVAVVVVAVVVAVVVVVAAAGPYARSPSCRPCPACSITTRMQ